MSVYLLLICGLIISGQEETSITYLKFYFLQYTYMYIIMCVHVCVLNLNFLYEPAFITILLVLEVLM